ncbi:MULTISPECIES: hypothetical protein [Bacillus]|uniref:hypothetical protein n=1 Tax=Bacillus TaxID=1386 RepID=UPI00064CB117|nr:MULTISPECIES: hypothetical protein [Bacillus amyloliquefaciens group]MDF9767647.1 regulator of replication initiation timing [Bacillus velezensis]MDF9782866.1 regulator of replication initiation timing [Bacillus velezensis]MEC2279590.1 hypothetical protein [Bacillus velezensis]QIR33886.1 hypothetical protein BVELS4_02630 [Bacillus velezensis]TNU62412.1 hypothetical protein FH498_09470 [Bacillus velezensis]
MSGLSQEQINKNLFDEVQRLRKKSRHDEEEIRRLKVENKKLRSEIEELEQITRDFESANSDLEDKIWGLENDAE